MRRQTRAWILGAVALAAAAGGVAVAAPGDGATVFACTNNLRQSIHFVDEGVPCDAGETLLTWNKQGPAGPPGERGPQGAAGVTFERSPTVDAALTRAEHSFATKARKPPMKVLAQLKAAESEVGEARAAYRDGPLPLPSELAEFLGATPAQPPRVVATLALPAGRWVVNAKAQAILDYDAKKAIVAAGATYDTVSCQLRAGVDTDVSGVSGFSATLALQVVHSYTTPGLVQLECVGLLAAKLSAIKITAIRVAKLKNQPVAG
ncbi:MAG: hypothetical protein V7607_1874 [Solirubrobacteraceae bacterium]